MNFYLKCLEILFEYLLPAETMSLGGWASVCACVSVRACVRVAPQEWEVAGVKVMNFYRPVPCVSALSLSLRAALPLKDNHAGQFVLRGPAEWASREVKYQGGTHTHTHSHKTYTYIQFLSLSHSHTHTHTHTPSVLLS